jgi:predicted nuclease with TOPRIM domain
LKEAEDFAVKIKEQISLRKKAHWTFWEELNAEIKNMEKVYEIVQEDLKTLQKEIEKILKSWEKNDRLFELLDQESLTIRKMNLAEERVGLKLTVKPERKVGKVSIQ